MRGEIVLLAEHDGEAAAGGVAGDPGTVDTAPDNEEIVDGRVVRHFHPCPAPGFSLCKLSRKGSRNGRGSCSKTNKNERNRTQNGVNMALNVALQNQSNIFAD